MVELPGPVSVAEHRRRVLSLLPVVVPRPVRAHLALGTVLAADVVAGADVPGFATSAMDGYAVRSDDLRGTSEAAPTVLEAVTELPAGSAADPALGPGQAARIMTGAPVPTSADAIVPVEETDDGRDRVRVHVAPAAGTFVRPAGSDVRAGSTVLSRGRVLGPRDLAAAAAVGAGTLVVVPRPRVGILSTGDEVVPATAPSDGPRGLRRGQVYDANAPLLAALVAQAGAEPVVVPRVPDDEAALADLLVRVDGDLDVLVTSGGVSMGDHDVVKAVLAGSPDVWFGPVRMQPGKPQGAGRLPRGTVVLALPGNPVSVFASFVAFVAPALAVLTGRATRSDVVRAPYGSTVVGTVVHGWRSPPGREQLAPVRFDATGGIEPATAGGSASHLVASLASADGLAIVPPDVARVEPGDRLPVVDLRHGDVPRPGLGHEPVLDPHRPQEHA